MTDAATINTALTTVTGYVSTTFGTAATIALGAVALGLLIWAVKKVRAR